MQNTDLRPAPIGWDDQQFADTMANTEAEYLAFMAGRLRWSPLRAAGAEAHRLVMAAVARAAEGGDS